MSASSVCQMALGLWGTQGVCKTGCLCLTLLTVPFSGGDRMKLSYASERADPEVCTGPVGPQLRCCILLRRVPINDKTNSCIY